MLIPVSLAAPAVRLELTGGDLGDLRRSHRRGYGAPSWTRTNIVGLEGRLPVRSAGANWSGRTESNRPVPRWQRCRAPCAPAWLVAAAGIGPAASDLSGRCSSI